MVRTWAIRRLRVQAYSSNTAEQEEEAIRSLLTVGGLVSLSNRREIIGAIKLRLKDSDAGTRVEALGALNVFDAQGDCGRARTALTDASPKVRSTAWGLLVNTEKRNHLPDDFIRKHLLADLANEDDQLVAAALSYVSSAGWRVTMGRKLRENVEPWKKVLDTAQSKVLRALQHRPAVQVQAISACRNYPRSEPLLIQLLSSESIRFHVVSALMAVGTQRSIEALQKLQPNVSAQTQPGRIDSAIKIIKERLARQPI